MKLSFTTLAIAAMAGSASAATDVTFDPPLAFTQFDGDCDEEVVYKGAVVSIEMMEYGSFCVTDDIDDGAGGSIMAYSKVDIVQCDADKIYENWHECSDSTCTECYGEYKAYTVWDSIAPENVVGHCFDYTFSMDEITSTTRKVTGTFNSFRDINFQFDDNVNAADLTEYLKTMDDNSCIQYGPPAAEAEAEAPKDATAVDVTLPDDIFETGTSDAEESGASTLATTTAAIVMVATMLLA